MTAWGDLIVTLEPWELLLAATEAGRRWSSSAARSADDRGGQARSLDQDVAGVCGELAFAKWSGRYWTGGARGAGDVGGVEVRCRRAAPQDEEPALIVQPYDERNRPESPFVLVVGGGTTYRIVGWTTPRLARAMVGEGTAAIADPGNVGRLAIFVPQPALMAPDYLKVGPVEAFA